MKILALIIIMHSGEAGVFPVAEITDSLFNGDRLARALDRCEELKEEALAKDHEDKIKSASCHNTVVDGQLMLPAWHGRSPSGGAALPRREPAAE